MFHDDTKYGIVWLKG